MLENSLELLIWRENSAAQCAIAFVLGFPLLSPLSGVDAGFASLFSSLQLVLGLSFLFSLLRHDERSRVEVWPVPIAESRELSLRRHDDWATNLLAVSLSVFVRPWSN